MRVEWERLGRDGVGDDNEGKRERMEQNGRRSESDKGGGEKDGMERIGNRIRTGRDRREKRGISGKRREARDENGKMVQKFTMRINTTQRGGGEISKRREGKKAKRGKEKKKEQ